MKPHIGCYVVLDQFLQGSVGMSYKTVAFKLANIVEPPVTKSEFSQDSCELRVYFWCPKFKKCIHLEHCLLRKEVRYLATLVKG
jgi:hypothetical protein